jgi:hypothetical protein
LDKNGNPCVPPLGNGAKAAFDGSSESSPASTDKAPHAATSGLTVATSGDVPSQHPATPKTDGLHSDMQNLSVSGTNESTHATSTSTTNTARPTNTLEASRELLSMREVPVVKTAEGPPAGAVVFDHPPSEEEQKRAEKLLQDVGSTA